jgi:DNA primase
MRPKFRSKDILKQINMIDLVAVTHPGVFINKRGKSKCPLHSDNNPSFGMRTIDGIDRWICWAGCGRGNAIDFLIDSKTTSSVEDSINFILDHELISKSNFKSADEKKGLIASIEKMRYQVALYKKFAKFVKDRLLSDSKEAHTLREYLYSRGIEDVAALVDRFYIGFFDSSKLETYKFNKKDLRGLNLLDKAGKLKVEKSFCFMYERTFGEISGIKFYDINTKKREWCGPKGLEDIGFFGLTAFSSDDVANNDLILVEGEFDVLVPQYKALSRYGDVFGMVCRSGSAATNPKTFDSIRQHGVSHITILPDNDEGGRTFIEKCAKSSISNHMTIDVVMPSQYTTNPDTDPAELFKDLNADDIRNCLVNDRKPISKYLAEISHQEYLNLDETDPSNLRIKGINLVVDRANDYGLSDLMRDEYASELQSRINDPQVSYQRLRTSLERKTQRQKSVRIGRAGSFSVDNSGYMLWIPNQEGDGHYRPVTNFTIRYDKIVKFPSKDEFEIEGHILLNGKKSGDPFVSPSSKLITPDDFVKFITTRFPIGVQGLTEIKGVLPELVSRTNSETPMFKGIDRVGYVPGTRSYVTPSTIVENGDFRANTDFNVTKADDTINSFFEAVDFTLKDLQNLDLETSKKLIIDKYLNAINRKNSLLTLGHAYSSLLTPYFKKTLPPHALFFRGLAGSFKSTFAQVTMGLFYKDPFQTKWPHANDTPLSVEMALSYVNNAPLLLDDVKPERDSSGRIMLIIQSLYDRQGRSRLNKDLSFRKGRSVSNEALIVTGEMIPTNQLSILSRMIQIEFKKQDVDLELMEELKDNVDYLRHITPGFIRWLQQTYDSRHIDLLDLGKPEYKLERTYHQLTKMVTGLDTFLSYLVEEVGLPSITKRDLLAEATEAAMESLESNLLNIKEYSTETSLIGEISALIQTKLFSLHGYQEGAIEVGEIGSNGDTIILDLQKLILGIKKHGTTRDGKTLLPQMMKDFKNKGLCKQIGNRHYEFSKELFLDSDDNKNQKQPPETPGELG